MICRRLTTAVLRSGDGIDNDQITGSPQAIGMRLRRSKLTDNRSERLLEHFVAGTPARVAAELVGVNRNTSRLFYHRLREIIAQHLALTGPLAGELEIDVAGPGGAPGRAQGRAATGRTPVFGLLRRGGRIHTVMAPAVRVSPPAPKTRVRPDSIVYLSAPDIPQVLDVSRFHHERVRDRKRAARGRGQIDSIENFWGQAKRQLHRYGGISRLNFHLFLKECEWRFNHGSPGSRMKTLKHWIKTGSR